MGQFVSDWDKILTETLVKHGRCRADYMQGTRLTFRTKEDAMHFAEKQGQFALYNDLKRFS
jgi:hypothetical protein